MKKGLTIAIIAIVLIIGFVAIYGAFAKSKTTTVTGSGGTQETHGSAFSWLKGILSGLSVSLVGK